MFEDLDDSTDIDDFDDESLDDIDGSVTDGTESDEDLLAELQMSDIDLSESMSLQESNYKDVESLLNTYSSTDETLLKVHTKIKQIEYPFIYVESLSQLEYKNLQSDKTEYFTKESIDLYLKIDNSYRKVSTINLCIDSLLKLVMFNSNKRVYIKTSKTNEISLDDFIQTLLLRRR